MFEKVKEILSAYTDEEITENSTLAADLGFTSFDLISILIKFEEEFDIEIGDKDVKKLAKVSDIVEYIKKKQGC